MSSPRRSGACAVLLLLVACAEPPSNEGTPAGGELAVQPRSVEAAAVREADEIERDPIVLQPVHVAVNHPCASAKAKFGTAVAVGDVDGDGQSELVVGADGEGAIYVLRRQGSGFQLAGTYQASGSVTCPVTKQVGGFGAALAVGDLDGVASEEVAVGAPTTAGSSRNAGAVYVVGISSAPTQGLGALPVTALVPGPDAEGLFGRSLAVGDFDGDGTADLAVGAPAATVAGHKAGVVVVHFGPVGPESERLVLANPAPVQNGNFGHELTAGDWNGDGVDDLVVSAVGNTVDGAPLAGQAFVFSSPLRPNEFLSIEDPVPVEGDAPRFGMHVAQRGDLIAIGSPRKDWRGIEDAGLGVLFQGRALDSELFPHPQPFPDAILGFRVVLADLVGDARIDLAVATLPETIGSRETGSRRADRALGPAPDETAAPPLPNRGFWIWDGAEPGPPQQFRAAPGSADHFPQGVALGQLWPGGREELVLGDYSWDRPGEARKDNVGRVVVYRLN